MDIEGNYDQFEAEALILMHQDALEDGLELKPSFPNQKASKMGVCVSKG